MSAPNESPLDLRGLWFEPLAERPSKVRLADLGQPASPWSLVRRVAREPTGHPGRAEVRRLRDALLRAFAGRRPVVAALGRHVVKTGCAPYLIDLTRRGVLTGFALNGSAAIHDLELAIVGHTSEDVGLRLAVGAFGFAREISALFARACRVAVDRRCGLGAALGEVVAEWGGPGLESSLLVAAARLGLPLTVHVRWARTSCTSPGMDHHRVQGLKLPFRGLPNFSRPGRRLNKTIVGVLSARMILLVRSALGPPEGRPRAAQTGLAARGVASRWVVVTRIPFQIVAGRTGVDPSSRRQRRRV